MALPKRLGVILALAFTGALAMAGATAAEPPEIESKKAEAQSVLAQIEAIDMELGRAVDAYNGATVRLEEIEAELADNTRRLRLARGNLREAQGRAAERVFELYTSGEPDTIEVLLGATSFADLLERVDTAGRIADQDARIAAEVREFKAEVEATQKRLERARAEQKEVVAERAAQRAAIEEQLAERQQLYVSIKDEIERLRAAERARQAQLAAQARARAAALERRQEAAAQPEAQQQSQPEQQEAAAQEEGSSGDDGGGSNAPPPAPSAPPAPSPPPPPAGPGHPEVVSIALQYLGVPYRWGGASPSGFDCSGFVMYVYGKIGISLPHHAASQYGYGSAVSRSNLAPGDIVFFNGLGHNGIYIGGGQFVHSPHTGDVVKISSLSDSWYASAWVGARRL
jgi:peptidoglycan DL-endopeptidase CwlO